MADTVPNPTKLYRKKPIVVKAFLLTRDTTINTLEGTMQAKAGEHYMVTGIKGENYPVRKDIFEELYELVEESGLNNT